MIITYRKFLYEGCLFAKELVGPNETNDWLSSYGTPNLLPTSRITKTIPIGFVQCDVYIRRRPLLHRISRSTCREHT